VDLYDVLVRKKKHVTIKDKEEDDEEENSTESLTR